MESRKQPGAFRVEPMGHARRLDRARQLFQSLAGDPRLGQFLPDIGRVSLPVLDHLVEMSSGEHHEHAVVPVIEARRGGDHEPAQAGALQRDVRRVDQWQSDDRVAGAADVTDRLPQQVEEPGVGWPAAGADPLTVPGQLHQEGVQAPLAERPGEQAADGHSPSRFVDHHHRAGSLGRSLVHSRHVPLDRHSVVVLVAGLDR